MMELQQEDGVGTMEVQGQQSDSGRRQKIAKEKRNSGVPGFWISGNDTVPGRSSG
jgi:hypothetical protein